MSGFQAIQESLWIFRAPPFYILGAILLALYFVLDPLGKWGTMIFTIPQLPVVGMVIKLVEQQHREGKLTPGEALDVALWRFLSLLGATVLVLIVFISVTFVMVLIAKVLAARRIGALILMPLWLLLILKFSLVGPAIVLDEEGPVSGYGASWRLTEGHTLGILLILVITYLPWSVTEAILSTLGHNGILNGALAVLLAGAAEALGVLWTTATLTCVYLKLRGDPSSPPRWLG